MDSSKVEILVNPSITPDQLWDFYVRNDICEVGYGKEIATKPLYHSSLVVAARAGEKLVGIARALFDGNSAVIMEFCLELELQGDNLEYENGSLIEKDQHGIGKKMGEKLLEELKKMGSNFIHCYIVQACEESFYSSFGLRENKGHLVYILDERPYVNK